MWRPLLTGAAADRALDTAQSIGHAVVSAVDSELSSVDPSLAEGLSGIAVFFAHLHQIWPSETYRPAAERALARAATLIGSTKTEPSLHGGFVGVAWATMYVDALLHPKGGGRDRLGGIDRVLENYLEQTPWRGDYDLISGLVGLGVYALERLPRDAGIRCAERVVARLGELAEPADGGITWHTRPELLPPQQRVSCPGGYYNLGVAHGVPGVIGFLGAACAAGIARDAAEPLLRNAVGFLLAQPEAAPASGGFPAWVGPGLKRERARVAWCYGDLGLAAALTMAATSIKEISWTSAAIAIARRAAARSPESSGVVDAGLCHGAAGVGHLFNRLWQATGDAAFHAAAFDWYDRTLAMREPEGVGGYRAYAPSENTEPWVVDPGLLTGSAGIGLALLAAATTMEPEWDRVLMVSARCQAAPDTDAF